MRYVFAAWALPLGIFWGWFFLSFYDINFGYVMLTRQVHDLVFQLYGKMLGIDPATIPPAGRQGLHLRHAADPGDLGIPPPQARSSPGVRERRRPLFRRGAVAQRVKPVQHALQDEGRGGRIDLRRRASCAKNPSRSACARRRPSTAARPRRRRAGRSAAPCCARRRATPARAALPLPSMLTGRPIDDRADILLRAAASSSAAASSENFLRMMTGRGWAKDRPRSDTATPIVFVAEVEPGQRLAAVERRRASSSMSTTANACSFL